MNWTLEDRGFLPNRDPITTIQDRDFRFIEQFARELPSLVDDGRFQEQVGYTADSGWFEKKNFSLTEFMECENDLTVERAFMLFCYFASAYIHARDRRGQKHNVIPATIARPLVRLSKAVHRPPILSYASYCLHNWKRIDKTKPIELGNIELLQNFSSEAKRDEDWFILVHVDIEARANNALHAIEDIYRQIRRNDNPEEVVRLLNQLCDSMVEMNKTLNRMPENCDPAVYFAKVRPYIFGFTDVTYEGCFDNEPQSYRGETGAQSSIIPSIINALGVRHKDSMLTQHLEDMKDYMPDEHLDFMALAEKTSIKSYVLQCCAKGNNARAVRTAYNDCLEQLVVFRSKHFEYAVNYIEKRVTNPTGTGGTPYAKWLKELIEETRTYFLPDE